MSQVPLNLDSGVQLCFLKLRFFVRGRRLVLARFDQGIFDQFDQGARLVGDSPSSRAPCVPCDQQWGMMLASRQMRGFSVRVGSWALKTHTATRLWGVQSRFTCSSSVSHGGLQRSDFGGTARCSVQTRDCCLIAEEPAPAPHLAHPAGCGMCCPTHSASCCAPCQPLLQAISAQTIWSVECPHGRRPHLLRPPPPPPPLEIHGVVSP